MIARSLFVLCCGSTLAGPLLAGQLDAPAAPSAPGSAMYTLENLYQRLATGATGAKRSGAFAEPTAGPSAGTMHTLDEIMGLMPAVDTAGANPAEVPSGKTFWGLRSGAWGRQTGTAPLGPLIYQPLGDGSIIEDLSTGLEWQRCSVGQTWNAGTQTCDGTAAYYTWAAAIGLTAPGGFRLPSIAELRTLVYCSSGTPILINMVSDYVRCSGSFQTPTIVSGAFPKTKPTGFWSSSPDAYDSINAWIVHFHYGYVYGFHKDVAVNVRLVRGGQ